MGLTPRMRELLAYIDAREICPSNDEMAAALGTSRGGIQRLLNSLEGRGHILRHRYRARAIEVIRPGPAPTPLPGDKPRVVFITLAEGRINFDDHLNWPGSARDAHLKAVRA